MFRHGERHAKISENIIREDMSNMDLYIYYKAEDRKLRRSEMD